MITTFWPLQLDLANSDRILTLSSSVVIMTSAWCFKPYIFWKLMTHCPLTPQTTHLIPSYWLPISHWPLLNAQFLIHNLSVWDRKSNVAQWSKICKMCKILSNPVPFHKFGNQSAFLSLIKWDGAGACFAGFGKFTHSPTAQILHCMLSCCVSATLNTPHTAVTQ